MEFCMLGLGWPLFALFAHQTCYDSGPLHLIFSVWRTFTLFFPWLAPSYYSDLLPNIICSQSTSLICRPKIIPPHALYHLTITWPVLYTTLHVSLSKRSLVTFPTWMEAPLSHKPDLWFVDMSYSWEYILYIICLRQVLGKLTESMLYSYVPYFPWPHIHTLSGSLANVCSMKEAKSLSLSVDWNFMEVTTYIRGFSV